MTQALNLLMLIRLVLLQGELLKTFGTELDKIGATSPSDRRRYLECYSYISRAAW